MFSHKFVHTFTVILVLAACLVGILSPRPAAALFEGAKEQACAALTNGSATPSSCSSAPAGEPSVNGIVALAINIFSWVVGIIAVIMLIVGGLKYITSSGDSSNVNSAKNTILYAVVGLVIVALAQVIVRFTLKKV